MKILISLSALIIALSVGYYFVIYIPQRDRDQQAAQKQYQIDQERKKEKEQTDLQKCLDNADQANAYYWIGSCEELGLLTHNNSLVHFTGSDGKDYLKDPNTKLIYSLDEKYVINLSSGVKKVNKDLIKNCRLPNDTISFIDQRVKILKNDCYKRFPQS